jgi:hypothetical protein
MRAETCDVIRHAHVRDWWRARVGITDVGRCHPFTGGSTMAIGNRHVGNRHVVRRSGTTWAAPSLAGLVLGVLGAAGVVISIFTSWRSGSVKPVDIPASFLWDQHATGNPSMLIWLIPIAAVIVIGIVVPGAGVLRALGGIAALVVCALFAWELNHVADRFGQSLGDVLDTGFYMCAIGGLLAVISGAFPSGWAGRSVNRSEYADDGYADDRVSDR